MPITRARLIGPEDAPAHASDDLVLDRLQMPVIVAVVVRAAVLRRDGQPGQDIRLGGSGQEQRS